MSTQQLFFCGCMSLIALQACLRHLNSARWRKHAVAPAGISANKIILCTQTRFLICFGSPNFPLRTSSFFLLFVFMCNSLAFHLHLSRFSVFGFHICSFRLLSVCLFICLLVCCVLFYVFVLFCLCFIMSFCIPFSHCQEKKGNRGTILEKLHKGGNHEND